MSKLEWVLAIICTITIVSLVLFMASVISLALHCL